MILLKKEYILMLTNNEIVTYVKYNMNVKGMIEKNIKQSVRDDSCSDLEQYIYEILLNKTNQYLNKLYSENKLANFITQIILNQRNYTKSTGSYYHRYLKLVPKEDIHLIDIQQDDHDEDELILNEKRLSIMKNILIDFFMCVNFTGDTDKIAINFLALYHGVEILNDDLILVQSMNMCDIATQYIDERINHDKLKTKTYLVKKFITIGKKLLQEEISKNYYILV